MEHCSYRHSDFLLVDYSFNVFYRLTPFQHAQTSLFLTQQIYLILLPHSITLLSIFNILFSFERQFFIFIRHCINNSMQTSIWHEIQPRIKISFIQNVNQCIHIYWIDLCDSIFYTTHCFGRNSYYCINVWFGKWS